MSLLFYTPLESTVKRKLRNPLVDNSKKKLIVHCCYHKVGTAWFIRVLRKISRYYGLNFQWCLQSELKKNTDIFIEYTSSLDIDKLPDYVGSHIIRDPRDVVISAYFYHLWTKESWALIPRKSLNNLSYQEYLNYLNQEEGLLAEMRGTSQEVIKEMSRWDYNNSNFFEFKYEDIIHNEEEVFGKIFQHYGFNAQAIQNCLTIAEKFTFKNQRKRNFANNKKKSHLRSGRIGEWQELFTKAHKQQFKELFGDTLIKLGYENSNDW